MRAKTGFLMTLGATVLMLGTAGPALADGITVTADKFPEIEATLFDPSKAAGEPAKPKTSPDEPDDLPGPPVDTSGNPLIAGDEAAVTDVNIDYTDTYKYDAVGGKLRVTEVKVNITPEAKIFLPSDADKDLGDHESAHGELAKHEYETKLPRDIEDALRPLVGRDFNDPAEIEEAIKEALARVKKAYKNDNIGKKFDNLTSHGTSNKVDATAGAKAAKAEFEKAPPAGKKAKTPSKAKSKAGTKPEHTRASYDDDTSRLAFGGNMVMVDANNPLDSINGRGLLQVDPLT